MTAPNSTDASATPALLRYENAPPLRIAGVRQPLKGNPADTIPPLWARIAAHIDAVAYGLCLYNDNSGNGCDYVAGIAISATAKLPQDWVTLQLPARRYAVFAHTGHVSTLQHTIAAIFSQWLPQSGQRVAPPAAGALGFFERYGEDFDPQRGSGDIEVWVPLAA